MDALDRGYLLNRSQKDRSYDLDIGDPLPTKEELLPSREELAEVFGRVRSGVRSATEHGPPVNTGDLDECSVRSVDFEGDVGSALDAFEQGESRSRPYDPKCCCADGGLDGEDGRCDRCYGWREQAQPEGSEI